MTISFLYHWAVSYFTDFNRVFRIVIEDSIIELYCRDSRNLGNLYLWINLRGLIVESFISMGRDFALLTEVFGAVRELISAGHFKVAEREALLSMVMELEVKLLREFRLAGVNELNIYVTSSVFYEAITSVLDIDGG